MNNLLKNNAICWVMCLTFGACSHNSKTLIVVRDNHTIEIRSDILCQQLVLNESGIQSVLLIRGDSARTPVNEFSFVVWKAFPDERPRGLTRKETSVEQLETVRNQTDALELSLNNSVTSQAVRWTDSVMVCSRKAGSFRIVEHHIDKSENEKTRLTLIGKLSEMPYAEDVVFEIVYEVFKDYPAIRKRIVIRNEGAHWLKIDHLTMAHIETDRIFPDRTHLTPAIRDIDPSIITFANADVSREDNCKKARWNCR